MKLYEVVIVPEEIIPAHREKRLKIIRCDICQEPIKSPGGYEVEEVEVSLRTGNEYPEDGMGDIIKFDIRKTCFMRTLIPFITRFGSGPTEEKWDW